MNRKGFTLIEVLAVIVIMGILLVMVVPNVLSVYRDSRLKSEEIFLGRLSQTIDSYVKLKSNEIEFKDSISATKDSNTVTVYHGEISIQDILNSNLLTTSNFINAGNKNATCNTDAVISVYRDTDYVYCYKIKSSELGCLINDNDSYAIDTCIWRENK